MVKNSKYSLMLAALLTVFSVPVYAFQSPDARQIVSQASEACKALDFVEYISRSEQGAMVVEAHVIQQHAEVADVGLGPARLIARGERVLGDDAQPFEFSYDGASFKFHEAGKGDIKTLQEPEPKTVGRTLGLFYYNVVQAFLINEKGLDFLLERADDMRYLGEVKLESGLAHHIEITQSFTHPVSKKKQSSVSAWYFDQQTHLPVKRTTGSIDTYTEFLSTKNSANDLVFDINPNDDGKEMLISGNEPNIEGLLKIGAQMPGFSLSDASGKIRSFDDVKGKVTLIDFWGTWCGPCLLSMPKLQALYKKYADRGLQVIGISVNDKPGKAEKYVIKKGYDYQFLVQGDAYAHELGLNTYPTVYIVDEQGVILHAEKGNRTGGHATFEHIIEENLKPKDND